MTVGEALAEARYRAGLTVDEVSERTRIREAVIRGIEQDDYDACGGDLYVRGYVRAIAGAIGIDAQPLIREYDERQADAPETPAEPAGETTATVPAVTRPQPILATAATADATAATAAGTPRWPRPSRTLPPTPRPRPPMMPRARPAAARSAAWRRSSSSPWWSLAPPPA